VKDEETCRAPLKGEAGELSNYIVLMLRLVIVGFLPSANALECFAVTRIFDLILVSVGSEFDDGLVSLSHVYYTSRL